MNHQTASSDAIIDTSRAPNGVYLIDQFKVPVAARPDFEAAMRRNRELLRSLDGFRGDAVFVSKEGGSFDIATIAAWESPEAMARAKEAVNEHYHRIEFDMHAAIASWGVTLVRTICEAPLRLQRGS